MCRKNRNIGFLILAILVSVWTFGMATVCTAADTVTLELKDVDVTTAIESLFKGSGKNFIIEPGVFGRIPTLSIKDVEFEQALKLITRTAGLTFRIDTGTYMVGLKPVSTGQTGIRNMGDGPGINMGSMPGANQLGAQPVTAVKPATLEKFTLTYTGPQDILYFIGGGNSNNGNNNNNNNNNNNSSGNYNSNNNNNSNSNSNSGSSRRSSSGSSGGSSRSSSRNNSNSNSSW